MKYPLFILVTSLGLSAAIKANDECPSIPSEQEQFMQLDTNHDHFLSRSEYSHFVPMQKCGSSLSSHDSHKGNHKNIKLANFNDYDRNRDGKLERQEFYKIVSLHR